MKKIISFCLWGDNKKYTIGAIRNAQLLKTIYPGWIARFYCGTSVPKYILEELSHADNCEVVLMNEPGDWKGMFWRFYPASESDVEVMLSRDCDSRLSMREKLVVDEWLKSDKNFLSLKDHPYHTISILGGMWGCKYPILKDMKELIGQYTKGNFYQVDQNFLTEKIYPIVKDDMMIFDEFYGGLKYNSQRIDYEFVGDSFDENDLRHSGYWKALKNNLDKS